MTLKVIRGHSPVTVCRMLYMYVTSCQWLPCGKICILHCYEIHVLAKYNCYNVKHCDKVLHTVAVAMLFSDYYEQDKEVYASGWDIYDTYAALKKASLRGDQQSVMLMFTVLSF